MRARLGRAVVAALAVAAACTPGSDAPSAPVVWPAELAACDVRAAIERKHFEVRAIERDGTAWLLTLAKTGFRDGRRFRNEVRTVEARLKDCYEVRRGAERQLGPAYAAELRLTPKR